MFKNTSAPILPDVLQSDNSRYVNVKKRQHISGAYLMDLWSTHACTTAQNAIFLLTVIVK